MTTSVRKKSAEITIDPLARVLEPDKTCSKPYRLASRETHSDSTVVDVAGIPVGGETIIVMAGPCCVESEDGTIGIARRVKEYGAHMLRGGAFKPRTSPYSFQGLRTEGLRHLARARELTGLPIVTELMSISDTDAVIPCTDLIQIGARNAQNTPLLCEAARSGKPILLKRGMSCTIEEWLMAAEYILSNGNPNVILCERGIRSFESMTRNTLDLSAVAAAKQETHLPVVVDPSHGTGKRSLVIPMARAAIAAGADGLLVEVHPDPDNALSDGDQSLTPDMFGEMMKEISPVAKAMGRNLRLDSPTVGGQVVIQGQQPYFY
jgi:3-deoxy-7-phosphoheptulonate synthase